MEPEGSLPHSQVLATCPYPEPARSSPYPHLPLPEDPSTPRSPKWSLSLRFPHQNPVYASPLPHTRYMPRPSHSSRFYHPNNIGWAVQIIQQYRSFSSLLCPSWTLRYIILYSHPCPRLPNGLFPSCFPDNALYTVLFPLICTTCPAHIAVLHPNSQHWERVQVMKCFVVLFSPISRYTPSLSLSTLLSLSQTSSACCCRNTWYSTRRHCSAVYLNIGISVQPAVALCTLILVSVYSQL